MANVLELPATGGWTSWKQVELTLNFTAGENLVTFTSLTENGAPNFDGIGLGSANLAQGSCSGPVASVRSDVCIGTSGIGVINRELMVKNGRQGTAITVCDLSGRLLWSTVLSGESGRYSMRNLPKGVIIIRITAPDGVSQTVRDIFR